MRERAPLRSGRRGTCRWALRGTAGYPREGSHFKLTIWRQELESPSRFIPSRLQQADLRLLGGHRMAVPVAVVTRTPITREEKEAPSNCL